MTLCNNDCTALMEEMLALVDLAKINCLLICHYLGLVEHHKCNIDTQVRLIT